MECKGTAHEGSMIQPLLRKALWVNCGWTGAAFLNALQPVYSPKFVWLETGKSNTADAHDAEYMRRPRQLMIQGLLWDSSCKFRLPLQSHPSTYATFRFLRFMVPSILPPTTNVFIHMRCLQMPLKFFVMLNLICGRPEFFDARQRFKCFTSVVKGLQF